MKPRLADDSAVKLTTAKLVEIIREPSNASVYAYVGSIASSAHGGVAFSVHDEISGALGAAYTAAIGDGVVDYAVDNIR